MKCAECEGDWVAADEMRQEADSRDGVMQRNEGFVIYKENKMVEKRRNECCEGGGWTEISLNR